MKKASVIKVLAAVLATASIAVFAGCNNDNSSESSSVTSATGNSESSEVTSTTANSESSAVASATASSDPLVGVWSAQSMPGISYTFNEDGSGEYDLMGNIMKIKYSTKDGKITIEFLEEGMSSVTLDYTLDGDTLNIKDSFKNDNLYSRQ